MRRLILFLAVTAAVLAAFAGLNWWVDPFGEVWKPGGFDAARRGGCLLSQELVGIRYYSFKLTVFHARPTRTFVVGSSRVLKLGSHPGERTFANLGYPGTAPSTLLRLFRALPARPSQTVYLGTEAFWFNAHYAVPDTDPSDYHLAEYLLSRTTFWNSFKFVRDDPYLRPPHRWRRSTVGRRCTIARVYPSINWRLDGSRVWSWELDPRAYPRFHATPFTGDLDAWRNGYYADWRSLDASRVRQFEDVLALAHERGWRVVGFTPPEPAPMLRVLTRDRRIAPRWREYLTLMAALFHRYSDVWVGRGVTCPPSDFPDAFHSDAACSARLRRRLDGAARRSH